MSKTKIDTVYTKLLEVKAQNSKTYAEVVGLKQNDFQKFLPSYIGGASLITSFVLGYYASRWAFNSQIEIEKKKKEKEFEFKQIDTAQKVEEERTKYYMEASKYRTGLLISSSVATKLQITISCMAKKYTLVAQEMEKFLMKQMEEQKEAFLEHSNNYSSDLKNYIAALSGYKMQKKGNTKINEHIEKMLEGIKYSIDQEKLLGFKSIEEVDAFMKEEKSKFNQYLKKEVKDEINSALEVILKNE